MAPSNQARRPAPRGSSPAPHKRRNRRSVFWRFRRLLFLFGLLAVAGLSGVGFVFAQVPLPPEEIQEQTTFVYDANGNVLAELHAGVDRETVPLDRVPKVLIDAVVAGEDRDFFTHNGIDTQAIMRATWADLRSRGAAQGGSTITQQYVKNVYVGRERSLWRKLKEAVLAVKLERKLDKDQILERYLNTIYLGRGAYGVQAASREWFDTDVAALDLREAAYLAGLIRAPEAADANRDPAEADRRRDLVLAAMVEEGYATPAEAAEAKREPVVAYIEPREENRKSKVYGTGTEYFVEYVRAYLSERYGDAAVFAGGLRVYTTIDLGMQDAAYRAVYGTLDREDDPAGALVAIDDRGAVKAMVGGKGFDRSKVNLAVGKEGGGSGRQPGSSFKPFVLAAVVSQGYSLESALDSPSRIILPGADSGADYKVTNYGGGAHGMVNLIDATRVSSNTVYAQLIDEIGPDAAVTMANRMGITTELPAVMSLTLGTGEVSVLDMADAYLTLATRGTRVEPLVVTKVTDSEGRVREENVPAREQVLSPEEADQVTFALRQVVEKGTGTSARFGKPVAGKTGTTQDNVDAWFVGYTPRLSVAVWMGYPDERKPMDRVHGREVTGGSFPAIIFRTFMKEVPADYVGQDFVRPRDFPGRILAGEKLEFGATTTTTTTVPEEETTTTTAVDPASTTTTAPPGSSTTTTAPPASTTTTTPPPTTTTTAPPPPPTSAPPVEAEGEPVGQ